MIPMAKDSQYYSKLLEICKNNDIKGILSINDIELPILAKYKDQLAENNIMAIISDPKIMDICFG
ncbi:hypothetical protein QO263_00010 [Proteiniborus sp. MB09-C3]|nr:hypothetical protein [Proteiniborus sp. MB09-C3]WIV12141.1 hypothetical protein QO263_00010 [Proteiniborus sp. MB09-C3]